ncbi:MAG: HAMP domain-containing protein, partial [Clostridiales bacterium]|nr:HAMP domain-containing protein [Clostridiales bacterium]
MRRRPIGIWLATVLLMGGVLLLSAALTGLMAAIGMHFGLVRGQPILGIIAFLVISASISMLLSAVFSRRFLRPLLALMKATQEVAAGNFDVRVEGRGHGELGELIEHFNLMARQLSRTEVLRADFVNNISHEIRTPVAAIENCATVLQSGTLTEAEQREYADMIAQNARRLSTLSRNVLDLSRLENQQIVTERRRFRLDEQVRQALVMLEPQWNAKGLELDIELAEADCEGNSGLLMQVWVNLLDNAIKFSPPGGRLAVRLV